MPRREGRRGLGMDGPIELPLGGKRVTKGIFIYYIFFCDNFLNVF